MARTSKMINFSLTFVFSFCIDMDLKTFFALLLAIQAGTVAIRVVTTIERRDVFLHGFTNRIERVLFQLHTFLFS